MNFKMVPPSFNSSPAESTRGDLVLSRTEPPLIELTIVPFTEPRSSIKKLFALTVYSGVAARHFGLRVVHGQVDLGKDAGVRVCAAYQHALFVYREGLHHLRVPTITSCAVTRQAAPA